MKKYSIPNAEFITFSNHLMTTSECNPYNCPNQYGQGCGGHCYTNTVIDPSCPNDQWVPPED